MGNGNSSSAAACSSARFSLNHLPAGKISLPLQPGDGQCRSDGWFWLPGALLALKLLPLSCMKSCCTGVTGECLGTKGLEDTRTGKTSPNSSEIESEGGQESDRNRSHSCMC